MKTITTFLLSLCILSASAQDDYEFSTFTAFYIPVLDGTSLTGGQIWDDPDFTLQLPFEFVYFGDTISALFGDSEFLGGILRTEIQNDGTTHALIAN
ncbi:MAG: hypothetical protein KDC12_15400, partial [Flavobacteriales bacterium]|nr:hypothetical protein [Flavobacteriales bacterium]